MPRIIITGVAIMASGLSIWKPVQFQELTAFFGGYDTVGDLHFAAMAPIACFPAMHVLLALIVPKSLRAMNIRRQGAPMREHKSYSWRRFRTADQGCG